jgi:hypothetical protein
MLCCQDDVAPGEVLLFNVHANYVMDWAHQLMYVHDQLLIIISSSGMFALLGIGSGPSKL